MKLSIIDNINFLEKIIEDYSLDGTLTNNYILFHDFNKYIKEKNIFYWKDNSNLFFFIQKEGFYRLYYLINNIDTQIDFSSLKIVLRLFTEVTRIYHWII